jgi:hypothetical protein
MIYFLTCAKFELKTPPVHDEKIMLTGKLN